MNIAPEVRVLYHSQVVYQEDKVISQAVLQTPVTPKSIMKVQNFFHNFQYQERHHGEMLTLGQYYYSEAWMDGRQFSCEEETSGSELSATQTH